MTHLGNFTRPAEDSRSNRSGRGEVALGFPTAALVKGRNGRLCSFLLSGPSLEECPVRVPLLWWT